MRRFGGPNGYGHKAEPVHLSARLCPIHELLGAPRRISIESTPAEVLLGQWAPAVSDQSMTSTCTAHAMGAGIAGTMRARGITELVPWIATEIPSQKGLYDGTRIIERGMFALPGESLPPLADEGAIPSFVARAISEVGIRPRRHLDPDDRNSDVDFATVNDEPHAIDLELAGEVLIVGEYFLDERAPDYIAQLRACLAARIFVPFAIFADTIGPRSVEDWDPSTGPLDEPNAGDPHGGGHYILATGYRTTSDGRTELQFLNSWGRSWGLSGFGWGTERFIAGTTAAIALTVRRAA